MNDKVEDKLHVLDEDKVEKVTYAVPKLRMFGTVAKLTTGGGSQCSENGQCGSRRS